MKITMQVVSAKQEVDFMLELLETKKLVPEPHASHDRSAVIYPFLLNNILGVYNNK